VAMVITSSAGGMGAGIGAVGGGRVADLGGERDLEDRGRAAAGGGGLEEDATAFVVCICCRGCAGAIVRTEGSRRFGVLRAATWLFCGEMRE
jgi:hypothetical protein